MQLDLFTATALPDHTPLEQWIPVVDFPRYEVSSQGRFRTKSTGRFLGGSTSHNGYLHLSLLRDGRAFTQLAHRLVVLSFLGPPPSPLHVHVNHRNKARSDNRLANLEWMTRSQNSKHACSTR